MTIKEKPPEEALTDARARWIQLPGRLSPCFGQQTQAGFRRKHRNSLPRKAASGDRKAAAQLFTHRLPQPMQAHSHANREKGEQTEKGDGESLHDGFIIGRPRGRGKPGARSAPEKLFPRSGAIDSVGYRKEVRHG